MGFHCRFYLADPSKHPPAKPFPASLRSLVSPSEVRTQEEKCRGSGSVCSKELPLSRTVAGPLHVTCEKKAKNWAGVGGTQVEQSR